MCDHAAEDEFIENTALSLLDLPLSAMGGIDGPKTMKFWGKIDGRDVLIMIDSGASHNFISHSLVTHIRQPVEQTSKLRVRIGDGRRTESEGK